MAHRDNPFDLDKLRIDPADPSLVPQQGAPEKKKTAKKWKRQFIQVPWSWIDQLKHTDRAKTYRVALLLIYEHWRSGGQPIQVTNFAMVADGVSRRSKWRALSELEKLGLIRVIRRPRKSPEVTLLVPPQS